MAYGKRVKIYPLSQAKDPPATTFVDAIDVAFDSTIPYDLRFFQSLDRFVCHLGNAAMLPLYGMAVVSDKHADPASFVAITIVVAQGIMILTSLAAMQLGEQKGLWLVLLISFAALPVRGVVAALVHKPMGRLPCANPRRYRRMQSVAVPGLVACILNGTGRINVGLGTVMTAQGVGASLSPAIGGWIAQEIGYSAMFLVLGAFAIGSVALWLGFASTVRDASRVASNEDELPPAAREHVVRTASP